MPVQFFAFFCTPVRFILKSAAYRIPFTSVTVSVQQGDRKLTASVIALRSGFAPVDMTLHAEKIFPALQKPHMWMPAFPNPLIISWYSSVLERCSSVIIEESLTTAAGMMQLGTGF